MTPECLRLRKVPVCFSVSGHWKNPAHFTFEMLVWVPKLIYSKTGIKANSAAASEKRALGSVILLHIEGKIQELGQGPSLCTVAGRVLCGRGNLTCVLCFNTQYSTKTSYFAGQAFLPPYNTTSCLYQRLIFRASQGLQGI